MHSMQAQPDHLNPIQNFLRWVDKSCVPGIQDPALGNESVRQFLPYEAIDSYFRKDIFRELQKILEAIFGGEPPVDAEIVVQTCPKVFCILLVIGKGRFIQSFTQTSRLHDLALPLDPNHPPAEFSKCAHGPFYKEFCEKQWTFCAKPMERGRLDLQISDNEILPIIEMEKLGGGASAVIQKIVLHQGYNLLEQGGTKQNPNERFENTFILKTYRTSRAEKYYKNEIAAFRRLKSSRSSNSYIIGFHGSFVKGETYNVLLEYADKGTLEEYFQSQEPPTRGEDIFNFWNGLFEIIKALIEVHDVPPVEADQGGPQIMRGWHQDVKPANILVASKNAKSPYGYQFKLADLGLTHFRKVSSGESDTDSHGTRAYGAPETYRPDSIISILKVHQNVDIWSLGAVLSEAAVWVANGFHGSYGVEAYRRARQQETNTLGGFEDGDSFHNGDEVLQTVKKFHQGVLLTVRAHDFITKPVLIDLVPLMLAHSDERMNAKGLWRKVRRIKDDAALQTSPLFGSSLNGNLSSPSQRMKPPISPSCPPPMSRPSANLLQNSTKDSPQITSDNSFLMTDLRSESRVRNGQLTEPLESNHNQTIKCRLEP